MNKSEVIRRAIARYHQNAIVSTNRSEGIISAIVGAICDEIDKPIELKVKRTEDAKKFPLIHAKKDGDVGFDLPAVLPYNDCYSGYNADRMNSIIRTIVGSNGVTRNDAERMVRQSITINPGERGVIPTGISLELPDGYWASIEARSSTSRSMLVVPKGVIDEGYRGELFAVLLNVGKEPVTIYHGDRYVQLIIYRRENVNMIIKEVDKLSTSERGDTGFGSTGRSEKG